MTLAVLGWNERWQKKLEAHAAEGLVPGRVVGEHRSHFRVAIETTELTAHTTGRMHDTVERRSDLPGVGDFVAMRLAMGDGPARIEAVLPRISALVRKAASESQPQLLAANIDVVFIMTTPDGDLNLPRLERYLALVRDSGAAPVIVVNKADLIDDAVEITGRIAGIAAEVPIQVVSARARDRIHLLERFFDGNRTIALVGSSGVGKSTLTNLLLGRAAQATQEVRAHDNRGRHTTTHRQLFTRPEGGSIIDTPGMRALEVWNAPGVLAKPKRRPAAASRQSLQACVSSSALRSSSMPIGIHQGGPLQGGKISGVIALLATRLVGHRPRLRSGSRSCQARVRYGYLIRRIHIMSF